MKEGMECSLIRTLGHFSNHGNRGHKLLESHVVVDIHGELCIRTTTAGVFNFGSCY